jgi:spermidine/putrescine transport system substrate-binding protein
MSQRRNQSFLAIAISLIIGLTIGTVIGGGTVYFYKSRPPRADTQLRILSHIDAIPKNLLDKFLAIEKIQVRQDVTKSNSELLEKLNDSSHEYDLVVLLSWQIPTFIDSQLLMPIKKPWLPNLRYVAADFKHLPHDKELIYSVPIGWGVNGLVYNKKHISSKPASWTTLLKEKDLQAKIAFLPDPRELMAGLIRRHAISNQDMNSANTNTYLQAFEQVLPFAKNSPKKTLKALGQGDLWAAELPSGMVSVLMSHSDDFGFVIPEESASLWTLSLAPCRGSSKSKEAHRFIDFMLSKDSALELTRSQLMATPLVSLEYENLHSSLKPSYIRALPLNRLQVVEPVSQMAKQWESTVIEKTSLPQ